MLKQATFLLKKLYTVLTEEDYLDQTLADLLKYKKAK